MIESSRILSLRRLAYVRAWVCLNANVNSPSPREAHGKRASRGEGESTSADWLSLAAIGFCDVTK